MILGHESVRRQLGQALASGRVGSAYLFLGQPGIGKRLMALQFAAGLNCQTPGMPPCGECASCRKIGAHGHPDVIVLEPEGNFLKIDQVRELASRLKYRAYEGRTKVAVVNDADKMTDEAQAALLKTLEEPPADTVLILIVGNLTKILPTIISRCQLIRFRPLPPTLVEKILRERFQYSEEQAQLLAGMAEGSVAVGLSLERKFIMETRPRILRSLIGQKTPAQALDLAAELLRAADDPLNTLDLITSFYRDVLHTQLGASSMLNKDLQDLVREQAQAISPAAVLKKLEAVQETRERLLNNANKQLAMELLALTLGEMPGARIVRQ